ncbi:MAG: hypothetical protein NVS4B6_17970 [Mycobacterium sp.]
MVDWPAGPDVLTAARYPRRVKGILLRKDLQCGERIAGAEAAGDASGDARIPRRKGSLRDIFTRMRDAGGSPAQR